MRRPILFNHIPRTGGTTLRIIMNRVYGESRVFFIRSKDINASLEEFKNMDENARSRYEVVSGHGAMLFEACLGNPFRITIMREPISMFVSQYHYLRSSPNSNFLEEVSSLHSLDDYIDYALANGQDNMLTRFLSGSQEWLLPSGIIPSMAETGEEMLQAAKKSLERFDAVLELENFDNGIYALSSMLQWKSIPFYRASNKGDAKGQMMTVEPGTMQRIEHLLHFDIALFKYFRQKNIDIGNNVSGSTRLRAFRLRQKVLNKIFRIT